MTMTNWQNPVNFLKTYRQIDDPNDRNKFLSKVKCLFPKWKLVRKRLQQCVADGHRDACMKASEAELRRLTGYCPVDQARNIGRDESRLCKQFNDQTVQDALQFPHFLSICRAYELDPRQVLRTPAKQFSETVGFCRALVKLYEIIFPDRALPKLRNSIAPVQIGIISNEILVWPYLEKLDESDWSPVLMMSKNRAFEARFAELMVRINQPIHDSNLADKVEIVTFENLKKWLRLTRELIWPYFLLAELHNSEKSDDAELPFPIVGIFDEFDDDGNNQYYWTIPA